MAQEHTTELRDLVAVDLFYMRLLEKYMGGPVPVPAEISAAPTASGSNLAGAIDVLRRYLLLLDMAISAPMVRDALKESTEHSTAVSLFRYYLFKQNHSESDRDKTDFISTYLLKHPAPGCGRPAPQPAGHSNEAYSYMFSQKEAQDFQAEIERMLGVSTPELPPEHQQLLREFQYLHQEADEFRHFDQLMDSGILQRVRELKTQFGCSFYNPRVLAPCAVYNVFFGKRFDDLFREAAAQIKAFAAKVQQEGGSIMSRVDGDVTVKHLQDVEEESQILKQEYGHAKEHFHKVSKFKKAVDSRRSGRPSAAVAPAPKPVAPTAAAAAKGVASPGVQSLAESTRVAPAINASEENKIRGMVESIRNFVHAADPAAASVVPMRNKTMALTPGELEAFKADYSSEKSFRADFANMLTYLVAIHTRMQHEMEDYKSKRGSAYLWKPHADALAYLMTAADRSLKEAEQVCVVAGQRGLGEKAKALHVTMEKVRAQISAVAQTLQT